MAKQNPEDQARTRGPWFFLNEVERLENRRCPLLAPPRKRRQA
jgi:hypothetical protein